MVCLGLKPGAVRWKAQMNPPSYGGIPRILIAWTEHLRSSIVLPIIPLEERSWKFCIRPTYQPTRNRASVLQACDQIGQFIGQVFKAFGTI